MLHSPGISEVVFLTFERKLGTAEFFINLSYQNAMSFLIIFSAVYPGK